MMKTSLRAYLYSPFKCPRSGARALISDRIRYTFVFEKINWTSLIVVLHLLSKDPIYRRSKSKPNKRWVCSARHVYSFFNINTYYHTLFEERKWLVSVFSLFLCSLLKQDRPWKHNNKIKLLFNLILCCYTCGFFSAC